MPLGRARARRSECVAALRTGMIWSFFLSWRASMPPRRRRAKYGSFGKRNDMAVAAADQFPKPVLDTEISATFRFPPGAVSGTCYRAMRPVGHGEPPRRDGSVAGSDETEPVIEGIEVRQRTAGPQPTVCNTYSP